MADDLSAPLGQDKAPKRTRRVPLAVPYAVLGIACTFIVVLAGWAMIVDDPFGGEPLAIVSTDLKAVAAAPKPEDDRYRASIAGRTRRRRRAAEPVRRTCQRGPAGSAASRQDHHHHRRHQRQARAGRDPRPDGAKARCCRQCADRVVAPRPAPQGRGRRLARRGCLCAAGQGTSRPARRAAHSQSWSADSASAQPPPAMPSAICPPLLRSPSRPTANDLERLAARARNDGHEVLLQVPMEPLDYPDNDPGPQHAAHLARRRAERRPSALVDEPHAGLCRASPTTWAPASLPPSRRSAGDEGSEQARSPLPRRRLLAAQHCRPSRRSQRPRLRQSRPDHRCDADRGATSIARSPGSRPWRASAGSLSAWRALCRSRWTASPNGRRPPRAAASCWCRSAPRRSDR